MNLSISSAVHLQLLALVLALVLAGCVGGLSEAEKHYNAGVKLQNEGRQEDAIAEYDEAVRLGSQFVLAHYNRGNAHLAVGQIQQAIEDYDCWVSAVLDSSGSERLG